MDWLLLAKATVFIGVGTVLFVYFCLLGCGSIAVIAISKIGLFEEKHLARRSWLTRAAISVIDALIAFYALFNLFAFVILSMLITFFGKEPLILTTQVYLMILFSILWLVKTYWMEKEILGEAISSIAQVEREIWPESKQSWRELFERVKSLP